MLDLVHPGEEYIRLFSTLFLQRLPAAVCLQLTEDDHKDFRTLADKGDRCVTSIHHHQQLLMVSATVMDDSDGGEEQSVSAVVSQYWAICVSLAL